MTERTPTNTLPRLSAGALWLVLALAAELPAQRPADEPATSWLSVPGVGLDGLEPAVARQLGALRELVEKRVADPLVTGSALGELFGELGRHYHAYDLAQSAAHCYAIAQRLAPEDFRWPYLAGYLAQGDGHLEEAVALYQRALENHAEVPPALVRLGQTLADLNRLDEAERVLARAAELNPADAAAPAALGQIYLAAGRYPHAIRSLESALDLEPAANRLYYPLALAYRGQGDLDRAAELLARRGEVGVRPADPLIDGLAALTTGERVRTLRGRAAFAAGRYVEAIEEFRAALEAAPDSVPVRINLAAALAEIDAADEAIAHLREAVERAPGNATALFNLGVLLEASGAREQAIERLAEATSYAPADAEMRLRLADSLRQLGRLEEALHHYGKAVALEPALEAAWVGEADTLARLERFTEARTRLETASRLMPTGGMVAHGLARLLAAAPDPAVRDGERALDLALRVVEARPTVPHMVTTAMAHAEVGRCEEAAGWQARAVEEALEQGDQELASRLERVRSRYASGPPCRPPMATPRPDGE